MAPRIQRSRSGRELLVEIMEAHAPQGEWIAPAVTEIRLALALTDLSAKSRRGSRSPGLGSVSTGMMGICDLNQPHRFEMRESTSFAIALLRNEPLEQAFEETAQTRIEIEPLQTIQDEIMRRLIEVLLYEMRGGFQSGAWKEPRP